MADLTKQDFLDYVELCKQEFGIKLVHKKSSLLMRLLSVVLFFNRGFLDAYYTTIGTTIYWVKPLDQLGDNPEKEFRILFHEVQHAHDYLLGKVSFVFLYLFPQVIAVMSLMAILAVVFGKAWLIWLVCLIFLPPIPSPSRMYFELRAYMCNSAYEFWRHGTRQKTYPENLLDIFTGSSYYFMWPFEDDLIKRLRIAETDIFDAGNLTLVQKKTYEFLEKRGLLKGTADG